MIRLFSHICLCCALIIMGAIGMEYVKCVTLKQECPYGEMHKSCSFTSEYTCWRTPDRIERVKEVPKRLMHCHSGCFCKIGFVREYPEGPCIVAAGCNDRKLQAVLMNMPTMTVWII